MSFRAAFGTGLLVAMVIWASAPPVAAAPEAIAQAAGPGDDAFDVEFGGTVSGSLSALADNDLLVYETMTFGALDPGDAGSFTVNGSYPSGSFTFTAAAGFEGTATLDYTGATAQGDQFTASIVFTVAPPPNRPPVAVDDAVTVRAGSSVVVSPLDNDSDPDDGDLLVLNTVTPSTNRGVSATTAGTTIRVRADAGAAAGTRTFTYTIQDAAGAVDQASLVVTVVRPGTTTTTPGPTTTGPTTTRPRTTPPRTDPGDDPRPPRTIAPDPDAPDSTATTDPDGSATETTEADRGTPASTTEATDDSEPTDPDTGDDEGPTLTGGDRRASIPVSGPGGTAGDGSGDSSDDGSDSTVGVLSIVLVIALGLGVLTVAARRRSGAAT